MAWKKTRFVAMILIALLAMGVGIASAAEKGPARDAEIRLISGDPVADAQFGRSVAMAGDLVAVGEGGDGAIGAVYLYKRQGRSYLPEATLVFPDPIPETCPEKDVGTCPEFGRTVAIQGTTVFVGARFAPAGSLNAGAVYVFRKQGDAWQFEDKIVSPSPEEGDNFGRALAVQGDLLVVTARKTVNEEGAAYVFAYTGGSWVHRADLVAGDPTPGAYFGQSVAIQGDMIAIGARNANPAGAGAAYLFRQAGDGWNQVAKVTPADGKKNDQYGFAIALSGDVMTVGARRADPGALTDAGAANVYTLEGDSVDLVTRLTPGNAGACDEFGQSVAIAGDVIAVGAGKDDDKKGAVYLFSRAGGRWIETGKLAAADRVAGDEFGYSLAASGNRLVTGAHFADAKAGAAYVLTLKP